MKYGINYGPVTQKIFAGRINKAGKKMLDDKEDVTLHAVEAVGYYVIDNHAGAGTLELSGNRKLVIEARIEEQSE